eukprot:13564398-Alexandrium_andersonii.AAC.1
MRDPWDGGQRVRAEQRRIIAGWPIPGRGFPDEDSTPASPYDVAEWMAEAARQNREAGLRSDDE